MDHISSRSKPMPIVNAVVTAAKLTSATYRIVATTVMGYYLVKGVVDYEKQRRKESKNVAATAYRNATSPNRVSPTPSRDDSGGAPKVVVAVRRRRVGPNRGRGK